jgi:hypothetical protein
VSAKLEKLPAGLNVRRWEGPIKILIQFTGTMSPSHLFGLFTSFNAELVNDVTLQVCNSIKVWRKIIFILDIVSSINKMGGDLARVIILGKLIQRATRKDASIRGGFRGSYINWFLGHFLILI